MGAVLAIRGALPGPLFTTDRGQYLTLEHFARLLSKTLLAAGVFDKHYTNHSFGIGAATTAKEAGISDVHKDAWRHLSTVRSHS